MAAAPSFGKICKEIIQMEKSIIAIVYHSHNGHTRQLAKFLADQMHTEQTCVQLLTVAEAADNFELLHRADMIVFGCPTYFGNISGAFKQFMEKTDSFWYRQLWKNKLAAAFTISSTTNGDKLNTLNSLFVFAAQHGMHWISLGILPRFINEEQTDGQNRMASYIGMMAQCDNSSNKPHPLHDGDRLTAELFAERIVEVTNHFKQTKNNSYDTLSN